jgi:hypothetical protein
MVTKRDGNEAGRRDEERVRGAGEDLVWGSAQRRPRRCVRHEVARGCELIRDELDQATLSDGSNGNSASSVSDRQLVVAWTRATDREANNKQPDERERARMHCVRVSHH